MNNLTQNLNGLLANFPPIVSKILTVVLILIVFWVIAKLIELVVRKLLGNKAIGGRLNSLLGGDTNSVKSFTGTMGTTAFWVVMLFGLVNAMSTAGMQSNILAPLTDMLSQFMGVIPDVLACGVILFLGFFISKIVYQVLSNFLKAVGLDRAVEKVGLSGSLGEKGASHLVALIAKVFILLPFISSGLGKLNMASISGPIDGIINTFTSAIPKLLLAVIIIGAFFYIGRIIASLVQGILNGLGFDNVPKHLGFTSRAKKTPSQIAGGLVLFSIMLLAVNQAIGTLGMTQLSDIVSTLTAYFGKAFFAMIIFALGLWFANIATKAINSSGTANASLLATIARVVILVITGSMALERLGVGGSIVSNGLTAVIGGMALALAIAFGWGGREAASDIVKNFRSKLK